MAPSGGWSAWDIEKQGNESMTSWGKPNQNQGEKDVTAWVDRANRMFSLNKGAIDNWSNDSHNAKDDND